MKIGCGDAHRARLTGNRESSVHESLLRSVGVAQVINEPSMARYRQKTKWEKSCAVLVTALPMYVIYVGIYRMIDGSQEQLTIVHAQLKPFAVS
jgi:hypothetical protein